MKTFGNVLLVLGCLMTASAIKLAVTKYDLSNSHELSECVGGFGVSAAILAVGLFLTVPGRIDIA